MSSFGNSSIPGERRLDTFKQSSPKLVRPARHRRDRTFFLLGETASPVDQLRIGVADESGSFHKSAVWSFWASKKGPDFYVSSSTLKADMKGSVHWTVMNFGFLQYASIFQPPWQGDRPQSRHLERLDIPEMVYGQTLHLWRVRIPGFALRDFEVPIQSSKHQLMLTPCPADQGFCIDMVLVQGDWRPIAEYREGRPQAFGALESDYGRSLLVFLSLERFDDLEQMKAHWSEQLARIPAAAIPNLPAADDNLQAMIWMQRTPEQAITMTELHGLRYRPG